jgi:hypothetical protein
VLRRLLRTSVVVLTVAGGGLGGDVSSALASDPLPVYTDACPVSPGFYGGTNEVVAELRLALNQRAQECRATVERLVTIERRIHDQGTSSSGATASTVTVDGLSGVALDWFKMLLVLLLVLGAAGLLLLVAFTVVSLWRGG